MAEFTYTFGAVGRNYETPQAAHDDNVGDLVADTDNFIFDGFDDADFTAGFTVDGSTTSAAFNMFFKAADGEEYELRADTGVWFEADDSGGLLAIVDDFVLVSRIGVKNTNSSDGGAGGIKVTGSDCIISRAYADHSSGGTSNFGSGFFLTAGTGSELRACITEGGGPTGAQRGIQIDAGSAFNCIARNFKDYGILTWNMFGGGGVIQNCIATDNGADFEQNSGTNTYNCSSDATATETGSLINKTTAATFNDAAAGDYRLKDDSDCVDAGLDKSGTFTEDFDGVTFGTYSDWHMGAYDTPVAAAGSIDGSAAGTSSAAGTLSGRGALAGVAAGSASAAGTLSGRGALAGSAAGSASASGSIIDATPSGSISGSAAGASSASGTLSGRGALAGSAAGSSSAAGSLIGRLQASGSIAGTSSASGSLSGIGVLLASAAGTAAAAATLSAIGTLQAGAAGVASASGSLRDGSAPLATRAVSVSRSLRADRVISKDFRVDGPSEGLTV